MTAPLDMAAMQGYHTRLADAESAHRADREAVLAACGVTEQTEDTLAEQVRMRIGDLEQVIDTAAKHWIALTIEHPVPWEGGIDEAMRAACDKIRRLALLAPVRGWE